MGLKCEISLKIPGDHVYKPGERLAGIVRYTLDKSIDLKKITLSFIGTGKTKWTEYNPLSIIPVTHKGREEYFDTKLDVLNQSGEIVTKPAGVYIFPFEFIVPFNTPSSFRDKHCIIEYNLVMSFEKPFLYKNVKKFRKPVVISSYIDSTVPEGPNMYGLQKTLTKYFASRENKVELKATVTKAIVSPGESVDLKLEVFNNSEATIKSVRLEITNSLTYVARFKLRHDVRRKIDECAIESDPVPADSAATFHCTVQTLPDFFSVQNSKIFHKDYHMIITMRLSGTHINPSLDVPLVIGTKYNPVGETSFVEVNDDPPTYWEAMAEADAKDSID